ncbi:hypothetical protein H8D29_02550 [PVC group bacterium]|nr:hypothetical protein [PVC group bacterium]
MASILGCETAPDQQSAKEPLGSTIIQKNILSQSATMRTRLVEVYKELWPLMPVDQQHEKLPELLSDELPELRSFGIERVSVLNRDGEAKKNELQIVVSLLHDPDRDVRLSAAKLLPEINLPNLANDIAKNLSVEQDINVAKVEIQFFNSNPDDAAIEPVLDRLNTTIVKETAEVLVTLLTNTSYSEENFSRWFWVVKKAQENSSEPTLLTLEAILGNNTDRKKLVSKLDSNVETIRIAVARGFAASGYWIPLIQRSGDSSMRSFAILALQKKGGLQAFKTLLTIRTVVKNDDWDSAALNILKSLDTRSFLLADDMLGLIGETGLRLDILMKVWEESENKSLAARIVIAKRTVPLLNSMGKAVEALLLLEEFGDSIIDEDMLSLRFSTAILASSWDSAADVRPEPHLWMIEWSNMKNRDPAAAVVIRQQIIQRFEDVLTEAQRKELELDNTSVATEETSKEQEMIP